MLSLACCRAPDQEDRTGRGPFSERSGWCKHDSRLVIMHVALLHCRLAEEQASFSSTAAASMHRQTKASTHAQPSLCTLLLLLLQDPVLRTDHMSDFFSPVRQWVLFELRGEWSTCLPCIMITPHPSGNCPSNPGSVVDMLHPLTYCTERKSP